MILIVDDRPENIFSLKSTLEFHGFEVDAAGSGEEALKKVLKTDYALIILDVQMPGMDGFEVAETISGYSKGKDIPIIFLSAVNTEKKFITRGYSSGGLDYVTKPVDPDILILKVKTFYKLYEQKLELKKMQAELQEEIEERKKAQSDLNEKMIELETMLKTLPQIAFTASKEGKVEFANKNWFSFSPALNEFPEVHPSDADVYRNWKKSLLKGESFISELRLKNPLSGKHVYHLLKIVPVYHDATLVRWVGTFTDIHQQKMANELLEQKVLERTEELRRSNRELESKNHELQQFASVASHDLKEPLRKIQVFSSIIKEKFFDQETEGLQYINRIISSSKRMSGLINDLLDYSRLSVNEFFQKVNLNMIVEDILQDMELIIQEKKAKIKIGKLPVIEAIPGQMRQLFQNLISNSLKFTHPGIAPHISITAIRIGEKSLAAIPSEEGAYCKINIEDNGIGFNEQYLDKIFTIFQRLNTRENFDGTGIGLAIAKKIIEKHNGYITAHSQENQGATFTMLFPLEQKNAYPLSV